MTNGRLGLTTTYLNQNDVQLVYVDFFSLERGRVRRVLDDESDNVLLDGCRHEIRKMKEDAAAAKRTNEARATHLRTGFEARPSIWS